MTEAQVKEIAKKVSGTTANVYRVAEKITGQEVGEEIFDLLRTHARLFKCEFCDVWLDLEQEATTDLCGCCLDGVDDL